MPEELEPEEISRNDFLGVAGLWSAAAALLFSAIGMLRLPKPRVLPEVTSLMRLGKPAEFAPGTSIVLPKERIRIVSTEEGIAVMSLICTHLGCIVTEVETGFDCPCHGSKFGPAGEVLGGPAPRGLPWLAVSQAPDGTLLANRKKEAAAGEYYQV